MKKGFIALLVALCLVLAGCSGEPASQTKGSKEGAGEPAGDADLSTIEKKQLNDYTWDDLSLISNQIAQAASDEEGREIARQFGLVEKDGSLTTQTKQIVLNNTRFLDVRLAGIRHDNKADGSGKAGLTFMTVGALDIRPINDTQTVEGGWQASTLRAWLANEVPPMLDDDLAQALVEVNKLTNNVGRTDSLESVTPTPDKLWLFSVHEVCGDVTWDIDEFRQMRGYQDIDGLLNAEGSQYEVFAQAGVDGKGNNSEFLSLAQSSGTSPWWYRSPYPFDWQGYANTGTEGYFYRVMESGYPESLGEPVDPSSIVVGFCV